MAVGACSEHSRQGLPVSLPAAKGKPIRGAAYPDGEELQEENIATSRAWRRGWSAGGDWPHSQPIDLLPEGGVAWGPEEVASRGLGCSSRKCVPCVRMGQNFRQEREYGHREAGAMSERSSRVYTRRGILDKCALVVRWMSKVALRVYTRDVFSDGGGPLGRLGASLMSGSASHVYTRDALSDDGQLSAVGCPVVRPCAREEALPQQRARGQNDWFRPRAAVSLP